MKARAPSYSYQYGGDRVLSFVVDREHEAQAKKIVDSFRDKDVELTVKKYSPRRSLSANNYSWLLTDQLSDVMVVRGVKLSKEEMHAEMVIRYGQKLKTEDGKNYVVKALEGIKVTDFYPYAWPFREAVENGISVVYWHIYRGSHTYTRDEMNKFISGIVLECEEQEIETRTPAELALMMEEWKP